MAMNRIPFQSGLSLPAFLVKFGSEEQCEDALEKSPQQRNLVFADQLKRASTVYCSLKMPSSLVPDPPEGRRYAQYQWTSAPSLG